MHMKIRVPRLILACCAILALAGVGAYAELQKGHYESASLGKVQQAAPSENAPDSQYGGSAYPLYPPELADGEGKAEVEGYCSMCHSTRYITMQPPLPAATWEAEVTKMKKTFGATIPDEAIAKIIQYLQTHYTPETRKQ
jgi:mono/diheme cytochrome c family protein